MKKIFILCSILLLFVGCNTEKEITYNTDSKTVSCKQQGEHGYMEESFVVEEGLLIKRTISIYTPHTYYEENSMDIDEALAFAIQEYENTVVVSNPPYSIIPPYDNGEYIVQPISVIDYTDVSLFDKKADIHKFLNKDNKIIFDLYIENLQEAWKENNENYSCSIASE